MDLFTFLLWCMILMLVIPFSVIALAYAVRDKPDEGESKKDQ